MYRTETVFTGVPGSPYFNRLHFVQGVGVVPQALIDATGDFWDAALIQSRQTMTAQVQPDVFVVDEVTGETTEALPGSSVSHQGGVTTNFQSNVLQGLVRLRTGVYVAGRQITGRIFIPALGQSAGQPGPLETWRTSINGAMNALLSAADTAGAPLAVWSPSKGQAAPVTSYDVWNNWAVQRSRRD